MSEEERTLDRFPWRCNTAASRLAPFVSEGWVNTISISLVGDDLPKITNRSTSWVKHVSYFFSCFSADEISWGKDQKALEQTANFLKSSVVWADNGTENVLDASISLCVPGSCGTRGELRPRVYFHSIDLCFVHSGNCWTSPCQLQQQPKCCFSRKALFVTILASCCTLITKSEEKIQHHVKSQFSMAQWRCSMGHIWEQLLASCYHVTS